MKAKAVISEVGIFDVLNILKLIVKSVVNRVKSEVKAHIVDLVFIPSLIAWIAFFWWIGLR